MKASHFGLPATTVEKVCDVLTRHPQVEKAVLYGSRAKGNFTEGSDVDLTLVGEGLDFDELLKILAELDDLLLPYTIDLSLLDMINHEPLCEHIQRVGVDFYRRQALDRPVQPA